MRRILIILAILLAIPFLRSAQAQSQDDIANKIQEYQQKIAELQGTKQTLSKDIQLKNSQIALSQLKITSTRNAIDKLATEIGELNTQIDELENLKTRRLELALHRAPEAYKRSSVSLIGLILLSQNFSDALTRMKYLEKIQEEDAKFYQQLQLTQNTFNERKGEREKKKAQQEELKRQVEQETIQLEQQKREKNALLTQTQGQEAIYQQLLTQAQAQLASFASFVSSQGAYLLDGQTVCDDWGCYYNQRDKQWGDTLVNGQNSGCQGSCTVLRVGCLVTSIAMVASHLGHRDILPSDIANSGSDNYSVGTAMLRKGSMTVKGLNINRTTLAGSLRPDLLNDGPVVVGVYSGPFGTHFVVVRSYTNGMYLTNDPYIERGNGISFTDHYSLGSVFEVDRISM